MEFIECVFIIAFFSKKNVKKWFYDAAEPFQRIHKTSSPTKLWEKKRKKTQKI